MFHVWDWNDPGCALHSWKVGGVDVPRYRRVDQICSTKNLDQVGDGV